MAESLDHDGYHLFGRYPSLKLIGIGKEIPFNALGVWIQIRDQCYIPPNRIQEGGLATQLGGLYPLCDIKHVRAFGNCQRTRIDIAPFQPRIDFGHSRWMIKAVFTRFQCSAFYDTHRVKDVSAPNQTVRFEERSNLCRSRACGNLHKYLVMRACRNVNCQSGAYGKHQRCNYCK